MIEEAELRKVCPKLSTSKSLSIVNFSEMSNKYADIYIRESSKIFMIYFTKLIV